MGLLFVTGIMGVASDARSPPCPSFGSSQKDKNKPSTKEAPEFFLLLGLQCQCPLQLEEGLGFWAQELNSSHIRSFNIKLFLMRSFFFKVFLFFFF